MVLPDRWVIACHYSSLLQDKSEEENKEPQAKKKKVMETNKKTGKLSLKQKSSNKPLSQENKHN